MGFRLFTSTSAVAARMSRPHMVDVPGSKRGREGSVPTVGEPDLSPALESSPEGKKPLMSSPDGAHAGHGPVLAANTDGKLVAMACFQPSVRSHAQTLQ